MAKLRFSIARVIAAMVLALFAAECVKMQMGDESGYSFMVGEQFVILDNGFRMGRVTWVTVVSFPGTSTAKDRIDDTRVTLGPTAQRLIRRADGRSLPPDSEPHLYFFEGDKLITFPIQMNELELGELVNTPRDSYGALLQALRKFQKT